MQFYLSSLLEGKLSLMFVSPVGVQPDHAQYPWGGNFAFAFPLLKSVLQAIFHAWEWILRLRGVDSTLCFRVSCPAAFRRDGELSIMGFVQASRHTRPLIN
jgi:hypothetical protein